MGVELREKTGSTEPCPVAGSREDKADLTSWWAGGRTGGRGGHVCGRGVTGAGPRGRTGGRGGHRRETRADAGGCPPAGEVSLTDDR